MQDTIPMVGVIAAGVSLFVSMLLGSFIGFQHGRGMRGRIEIVEQPPKADEGEIQWVKVTCPDGWEFQGPEDMLDQQDIIDLMREHGVEIIGRAA